MELVLELLEQTVITVRQVEEILEDKGFLVTSNIKFEYGKMELQLYAGIEELAELYGAEIDTTETTLLDGSPYKEKGFSVGNVHFFQVGNKDGYRKAEKQ